MIFQSKYDLDDNRAVIRRLHRGDMACFEACYKFYYRGLCSFASRWVPVSTAEDIVQDAMLYIWENRDKLLEELSLKGLLFMIVRNKAFDRIAHRQVRQRVHQQLSERFAERFESPDFYLGSELSRLYDEALARLPEQTRRIFEMSRRMGMTHQQIAAELGVSQLPYLAGAAHTRRSPQRLPAAAALAALTLRTQRSGLTVPQPVFRFRRKKTAFSP